MFWQELIIQNWRGQIHAARTIRGSDLPTHSVQYIQLLIFLESSVYMNTDKYRQINTLWNIILVL